MELHEKKCVPCEGGMLPFAAEEIKEYLSQINDWSVVDNKQIEKEFIFKNFVEGLAFTNKVGAIAEAEGHHPDIFIHDYKKVKITLSTHAIGGLSANDFILAAKIDQLEK